MTRAEALAEARKRWGTKAIAQEGGDSYEVGYWAVYDGSRIRKGSGPSWEAAFADADRREASRV